MAGGFPSAGAGAFTPASLPNLRIWVEPDGLVGFADNDPITTWPDQSGLGNDFTQSTADDRPICKTAILNGFRIARFDGASDFLESPYAASDDSAAQQTFACVFRTNVTAATQIGLWAGDGGGNGFGTEDEISMGVGDAGATNRLDCSYGGATGPISSQLTPFTDTANFHALAATFNELTNNAATKNPQLTVDDVAQAAGAGVTTNNYATWSGVTRLGRPGGATRFFNGDIAAVVVCATVLNAAQLTNLFNFWRSKFAL